MKKKRKRRHHRVPVALLGRFTADGTDDGVLHVLDTTNGAWRESTPRMLSWERDYYTVELDGVEPNHIENFLAENVESPAGPLLKELAATQRRPRGSELDDLLILASTQLVRVEPFRRRAAEIDHRVMRAMLMHATDPAEFPRVVRAIEMEHVSEEQRRNLRRALERDDLRFGFKGNLRALQNMFGALNQLLSMLAERYWYAAHSVMGAPDLVCSDAPAKLVLPAASTGELIVLPHGYNLRQAIVIMPLSPRTVLLGAYDRAPLTPILVPGMIEVFNRAIARDSRWVYAPERIAAGITGGRS